MSTKPDPLTRSVTVTADRLIVTVGALTVVVEANLLLAEMIEDYRKDGFTVTEPSDEMKAVS